MSGKIELLEKETTSAIIGAMYEVHRELGFGYREKVYSLALERVLVANGHGVGREVSVTIFFRGEPLTDQTFDMVVDERVLVEIKSTERLHEAATLQLFSYLCSTRLEVGLVLHFGRSARFHRVICENRLKVRHRGLGLGSRPGGIAVGGELVRSDTDND